MTERSNKPKEMVGYPVGRGIDNYAACFGTNRAGMLGWLQNKNLVLDIGAGAGIFHKEINLLREQPYGFRSDVTILPLDIIYGMKSQGALIKDLTHMAFQELKFPPSADLRIKIDSLFDADSVGASFTALPFDTNTFDGVIACYSFGIHNIDRKNLIAAYNETYRVLRPGGEALISVSYDPLQNLLKTYPPNRIYYSLSETDFVSSKPNSTIQIMKVGVEVFQVEHFYLVVSK